MKSFDEPFNGHNFPQEFFYHIKKEGFELSFHNSKALRGKTKDTTAYMKILNYPLLNVCFGFVYICTEGIGVDIEYENREICSYNFFSFEECGHKQAYDLAVDYVNDNR
jgi:hypothetical protein